MKPIKVGIIGAGRIGRLHAGNLVRRIPGAKVVAVADVVQEAAEQCAKELGIPKAYGDPGPIFADPSVDAVLICSSTDTHAQFIEQAAAAGKHIFCEKPIALDLDRIDRALAAVAQAGVVLQVGFNRRFDPNFSAARQAVAEGKVGKPHLLRITSRDPAPPPLEYIKVSGGIFLDMTIHDFDMARFLMGEEVVEVYATGAVLVDPKIGEAGDVDTAVVTMRFASGALGVIDNSRIAPGDLIVGLGSAGRAAYEKRPNSGIGSNGLTSARHELLSREYADRYPETVCPETPKEFVYCGPFKLSDPLPGSELCVGEALLSPTRSYAPVLNEVFREGRELVHGIVHATGGGQTKCLHFGHNVRYVKVALFEIPPVFRAIREASGTDWREMYQVFNMGHRMEIFTPEEGARLVEEAARKRNIPVRVVGRVEKTVEGRELVIESPGGTLAWKA